MRQGVGFDEGAEGGLTAFLGQDEPPPLGQTSQAGTQSVGVDGFQNVVRRSLTQGDDSTL